MTPGDDVTFMTLGSGGGTVPAVPGKGAKQMCKVPKVVGKKVNLARKKVFASGCKFKLVYKKSKRPRTSCSSSRARPTRSSSTARS